MTGDEKMDASRKSSAGHEVAAQVRRHRQDHLLRQRLQAEGDLHSGDEPIKLYSCFFYRRSIQIYKKIMAVICECL
jgi:hypothetical protein